MTFTGPAVDQPDTFKRLPTDLQRALTEANGLIAYHGVADVEGVGAATGCGERVPRRLGASASNVEPAEEVQRSFGEFLSAVEREPVNTLGLQPLMQFMRDGCRLQPGQLPNVYPPFCAAESASGVSLAAVPAEERLGFLAELARQLPAHGSFRIVVEE